MTEATNSAGGFILAFRAFAVLLLLALLAFAYDRYTSKPCAETFKQAQDTGATCVNTEFGAFTSVTSK
jgi:hypothetical protein